MKIKKTWFNELHIFETNKYGDNFGWFQSRTKKIRDLILTVIDAVVKEDSNTYKIHENNHRVIDEHGWYFEKDLAYNRFQRLICLKNDVSRYFNRGKIMHTCRGKFIE